MRSRASRWLSCLADAFVGTWVGAWGSGPAIELTITGFDRQGYASGMYCVMQSRSIVVHDVHRRSGHQARRFGGGLRLSIGSGRYVFTPREGEPGVLELVYREGKMKGRTDLTRSPDGGPCVARVKPL